MFYICRYCVFTWYIRQEFWEGMQAGKEAGGEQKQTNKQTNQNKTRVRLLQDYLALPS